MENEVLDAVRNVNEKLWEKFGDDYESTLRYHTDGYNDRVVYLGDRIWCTDDEGDRKYEENDEGTDLDCVESLYDFLVRTVNAVNRALADKVLEVSNVKF
ncbi:MAG: hypothetical protein WC516_06720 [Patescibacteria group bacterium]